MGTTSHRQSGNALGQFLLGSVLGLVVSSVVALLMTPVSGQTARERVGEKLTELGWLNKAKSVVQSVVQQVSNWETTSPAWLINALAWVLDYYGCCKPKPTTVGQATDAENPAKAQPSGTVLPDPMQEEVGY
jgi:hypothetical protein